MSDPVRAILLYKTEGSMDKAYGLRIVPAPGVADAYHLLYLNGRRGAAMQGKPKVADPATKLALPLTLDAANKEFDKVVKAKTKDGYTEDSSGLAYSASENAGRISGYRPSLPADLPRKGTASRVQELLTDNAWGLMEKKDGQHRGLISENGKVIGTNKNGLVVDIPTNWESFAVLGNHIFSGEHMRDGSYHVFDLYEKSMDFEQRYAKLEQIFRTALATTPDLGPIRLVRLATGTANKRSLRESINLADGEGVVYKRLEARFEEGKNDNSIREKFFADMTCFVLAHNTQRSVAIGATDPRSRRMVPLGNVTIPPDQPFPPVGELLDVKYLYWFEDGSLEQPTSRGIRTDVNRSAVTTDQILRIKPKSQAYQAGQAYGMADADDESEESSEAEAPRG